MLAPWNQAPRSRNYGNTGMTNTPHTAASRPLLPWAASTTLLSAVLLFALDHWAAPAGSNRHQLQAAAATPDAVAASAQAAPTGRTEFLERLGVAAWHKAGERGRGLKVAVLDSGFSGYRDHLGHALPDRVLVKSCRSDGNLEARASQHGILCGEVVHTIAPDAEILFANWEPDRPDQFLQALRWAQSQGAQIVTCSVIMPSWSDCEGGGSIHGEMARILGDGTHSGDMLFFACAGNTAERHWSGTFHDGGDGTHEWTSGCTDNIIHPWGNEVVSVELCCRAESRLDLSIRDETAREKVGSSVSATSNEHCCAVVRFMPRENHVYSARVHSLGGHGDKFHVVVLGGGLQMSNAAGSVEFPADGAEVVAIGAVDAADQRCSYSSCGPNSPSLKPDFVATVPFPSACRSRAFAGTSAASPQAASLAALIWSRHPGWPAKRVRTELCADAEQLNKGTPDFETGYGRIHIPAPDSRR
jgi:hypothetical protein